MKLTAVFASVVLAISSVASAEPIPRQDVLDAQEAWAESIVRMGRVYIENGDYRLAAEEHIDKFYAYGFSDVLFKPSLAASDPFRESFDEALSFYVGGHVDEDTGFALRPWQSVRFGEQQIITNSETAIAMGNYYFTATGSDKELKLEYTLAYLRDEFGDLRIKLHHSSIPYSEQPQELQAAPESTPAPEQVSAIQ